MSEQSGESVPVMTADVVRVMDHEQWLTQFRADAKLLADEDVNAEPDAW